MDSDTFNPRESVKRHQAIKVYMMLEENPGMSQAKACANVGIDPKTYRKWIASHDEMLQEFENTKREQERLEYAEILVRKRAVTEDFIKQAMKPGMSITERIKALDYIDKRIEELSSKYHVVDVEAEQDLLSGPKQVLVISRLRNSDAGLQNK